MLLSDGRKSLEPWLKDSAHFYPHQVDGVRILANKKSFLLCDEMGLGKTLEAIAIFCVDVQRGLASTLVVVCPVSLKENWVDEFEKFTTIPTTVLPNNSNATARKKVIEEFKAGIGPRVLILNYEQVKPHLEDLNQRDPSKKYAFDIAVFDEAHYMKNWKSARTKASLRLSARRNFMLTGTPILNNATELWPLLNKIDPVRWNNYWRFVNRHVVYGGYQDRQIIGVKNEVELQNILNEEMLRRFSADVLGLKPPVPIVRTVTLTREQRELYEQVKEELILMDLDSGEEKDINNALTKFLRLKQICGTTLSFTGEDNSAKFDRAIIDSVQIYEQGSKAIVFSQFRASMTAYQARLEEEGIPTWMVNGSVKPADRSAVVKAWATDSRPGVIICGLQVAGIGLNMTAARYVQFLDKLYVPALNDQAIARSNRIGQDITKAVVVVYYLAKDTIESRIEAILNTKQKTFDTVVNMDFSWRRNFLQLLKENA